MNYRHAFHAGNFADVVKHVALVAMLLHLRKKPAPFAVIDSHAGRGLYDLAAPEAQATGEADGGIAKLRGDETPGPAAWREYLRLVRESGETFYPGSPLIAAKLLRDADRLVAIEKHPEEAAALGLALAPYRRARVLNADGYARLPGLLPPPERRGVILIDPPFEAPDEFAAAAEHLRAAYRRFATGIYLLWFPVKNLGAAEAFCGEVLSVGPGRALRIDIDVGQAMGKTATQAERLTRAGLLVLNPPYGFAAEMREMLDRIENLLAQGAASGRVIWLAGSDEN